MGNHDVATILQGGGSVKSNPYGKGKTHREEGELSLTNLEEYERVAINSVGRVIAFWGFKENHGRIWALLYLRDRPFSFQEIQTQLELSKGATSMLLQDLFERKIVIKGVC